MSPITDSVDNTLLLATLPSLDTPQFLGPIISAAASASRKSLRIVLFSRLFNHPEPSSQNGSSSSPTRDRRNSSMSPSRSGFAHRPKGVSRVHKWDDILQLLTYVYVQATSVAQAQDKVLLNVDVLLHGNDHDFPESIAQEANIVYRVSGDTIAVPLPLCMSSIRQCFLDPSIEHEIDPEANPTSPLSPKSPITSHSPKLEATHLPSSPFLPVIALGGTFDHLHAGHKILLSMAAFIASRKLIVGVTDDKLLKKKSHPELLESLQKRMDSVREFLELFRPGIEYWITPIDDVFGPTGWDPDVQGLVVSKETISGADMIAKHREEHSLPPLQTFVIDLISSSGGWMEHTEDVEMMKQTKMSSTYIRDWIYEKQQKEKQEGALHN